MGPTWKFLFASEIGTSHLKRGDPCQDNALVRELFVDEQRYLIVACSDGAGSCPLSHRGSLLACEAFADIVEANILSAVAAGIKSEDIYRQWISSVRDKLSSEAIALDVPLRDLSCTLLTAVIAVEWAWFGQIGDGVIVVRNGESLRHIFWPQSGEYVNTTNFLTSDSFQQELVLSFLEENVKELAIMTDGLQSLALHFASRSVHAPFFEPMFLALRYCNQTTELAKPLQQFLGSDSINERTDDDKTLILATRIALAP